MSSGGGAAHLALPPRHGAINAAGVEAARLQPVMQQVQHLRHLAEYQHLQRRLRGLGLRVQGETP